MPFIKVSNTKVSSDTSAGPSTGIPKAVITGTTGSPTVDSSSRPGKVIYKFTGSGSITVGTAGTAEILIIGAGGGGGYNGGGGGGAGGYLYDASAILELGTLAVTVGGGGASINTNGNWDNLLTAQGNISAIDNLIAVGGGFGGGGTAFGGTSVNTGGGVGGSGGGGPRISYGSAPVNNISGQGYRGQQGNGITGGGGGGASQQPSGSGGGDGLANSITGSSVTYAGGGGGGTGSNGQQGSGGSGGGGNGGYNAGASGTANLGGGGGGGGTSNPTSGAGGSGFVVVVIG